MKHIEQLIIALVDTSGSTKCMDALKTSVFDAEQKSNVSSRLNVQLSFAVSVNDVIDQGFLLLSIRGLSMLRSKSQRKRNIPVAHPFIHLAEIF